MSFKSKQRAKHGHLFGDDVDPLNATSVSDSNNATDDPLLFSPKRKTAGNALSSQSAKTSSPVTNDPLLSSVVSSNETSNSTPILNHSSRVSNTSRQSSQIKSSSSSLFGDIDVSKLSRKRTSPGNGSLNSQTPSPSIRSSATLKSAPLEDDEDLLFGGSRSSSRLKKVVDNSAKRPSETTPAIHSITSPKFTAPPAPPRIRSPQLVDVDNTKKAALPSPASTQQQQALKQSANIQQEEVEERLPAAPKNEEQNNNRKEDEKQPSASSSSSFFGFFKSNRHLQSPRTSSPPVSSTSEKVSRESLISHEEQKKHDKAELPAPLSPAQQQPEQGQEEGKDNSQSQKKATLYEKYQKMKEKAKHLHSKAESAQSTQEHRKSGVDEEEEDDNGEGEREDESALENNVQFMEDEATRAFANDLSINFSSTKATKKPVLSTATYFAPELMEGLNINDDVQPTIRSSGISSGMIENNMTSSSSPPAMSTSSSTPTSFAAAPPVTHVDDPWLDPSLLNKPSFSLTVEPSQSSPLIVREQDIEPEKRTAFADLIQSWNKSAASTARTAAHYPPIAAKQNNDDDDEFLSRVAEERKDIAFAGIEDNSTNSTAPITTTHIPVTDTIRRNTYIDWMADAETENPWELND